jgi:hypothetical protein
MKKYSSSKMKTFLQGNPHMALRFFAFHSLKMFQP